MGIRLLFDVEPLSPVDGDARWKLVQGHAATERRLHAALQRFARTLRTRLSRALQRDHRPERGLSEVYVLIGKASGFAGNGVWLSFLLASIIAACTGLSYAELASAYPFDSAEYLYTKKAFRDNKFAFGIGWLKIASLIIACGAVALGFGGYLSRLTGLHPVAGGILLIILLTMLNITGIRKTMFIDIGFVILTVVGLLFVLVTGVKYIGTVDVWQWDFGVTGVMTGAALIFFAFLGFENIGNIAEESKNPRYTLPRALIYSIIISTALYVLVALVAISVMPWKELAASSAPLADVAFATMGPNGALFLSIVALAATASTVLGLFIASSRMIFGMAEEGSLPKLLTKITRKSQAPIVSILLTAVIAIVFILPGDITTVAALTDWGALFIFLTVNFALIMLRFRDPNAVRGFRVPLNIGKVPVLSVLGMLFCGLMIFHLDKKVFLAGVLFFLTGLILYSIFWEHRHKPLGHHERKVHHHIKHYAGHRPRKNIRHDSKKGSKPPKKLEKPKKHK